MRVLLDENLPHDLISALAVHTVSTVQGMGWSGVENGELLRRASGHTDAFVTMDRRLQHQQNVAVLTLRRPRRSHAAADAGEPEALDG